MIRFLGSILSIAILELSTTVSSKLLIEACMHCTKLLSKVYIEQCLEALIYFCDKAYVYKVCSSYSHVLAFHFNHVQNVA